MTRRGQALLIGAAAIPAPAAPPGRGTPRQADVLRGVGADLDRMAALLTARGFAVERVEGEAATYRGILDGLDRLIAADGAAVLYYSGHGGRARDPRPLPPVYRDGRGGDASAPRYRVDQQFLIPVDFEQSTETDFRGVTELELRVALDALTARTHDVTWIFDCCYAGGIVRGPKLQPQTREYAYPRTTGLAARLDALAPLAAAIDQRDPLGNPHAVRLFASSSTTVAWEAELDGVYGGALTEALIHYLDALGDRPTTWEALTRAVRERIAGRRLPRGQEPEVAGPIRRTPFGTAEFPRVQIVGFGGGTVRAGRSSLVRFGDTFAIVGLADAVVATAAPIVATVTAVDGTSAAVELTPAGATPPDGAVARPIARALGRYPVRVVGDAGALARAIEASPNLWLAGPDERDDALCATVHAAADAIFVGDPDRAIHAPLGPPAAPATHERVLAVLSDRVARRAFLELAGDHGLPGDELELADTLVGAQVALQVTNRARATRWIHVFAADPRGTIEHVTRADPRGRALDRDATTTTAWKLTWPSALPARPTCEFELLVIATAAACDLTLLAHAVRDDLGAPVRAGATRGPIARDVRRKTPRDLAAESTGFAARRRTASLPWVS